MLMTMLVIQGRDEDDEDGKDWKLEGSHTMIKFILWILETQ